MNFDDLTVRILMKTYNRCLIAFSNPLWTNRILALRCRPTLSITRMISDRVKLYLVLLPLLIYNINNHITEVMNQQLFELS